MRTKKYYSLIAEEFNMATAFLGGSCQLCLPGALISYACRQLLSVMPAKGSCQFCLTRTLPGALVSLVLILKTSRDKKKLGFLTLGVLNVGIMNFGCFETGCFGFGCVGAGQIEFCEFHYWAF
jgi:hypothetical protein